MKLFFYTEARFIKNSNNEYFNDDGSLNNFLWKRYLKSFSSITIVARVKYIADFTSSHQKLASTSNVSFIDLPYFIGPYQYLKNRKSIKKILNSIVKKDNVHLMRVPGAIGNLVSKILKKKAIPYGVEVVGDPIDVFSKGAINHPLRVLLKYLSYYNLKELVYASSAALYVTEYKLQSRYPVKNNVYTTSASNVILDDNSLRQQPKILTKKSSYELLSIGSLSQMYKAPDVVLRALKELIDGGFDVKLTWLGAGKFLNPMKDLATEIGVSKNVQFLGFVSDRDKIIQFFDKADIFILVSRTEGLPRAIIEAMGRGLPVIGSNVGGIPELVSSDMLVEKDNHKALSEKIFFCLKNLKKTNSVAKENLEKSKKYLEVNLNFKREEFYTKLITNTKNAN